MNTASCTAECAARSLWLPFLRAELLPACYISCTVCPFLLPARVLEQSNVDCEQPEHR